MCQENTINYEIFKVVKSAVQSAYSMEDMGNALVQLLTGALTIKGCTLSVANPEKKELEIFTTLKRIKQTVDDVHPVWWQENG